MTSEQNLFWYGLGAIGVQIVGAIVFFLGLLCFFVHWIVAVIVIILGLVIVFKGRAMRFQYQMRSGSIIHRGDW